VGYELLRVYATPRRLALTVSGMAEVQERRTVTVTGPPKKAAYDAKGAPTRRRRASPAPRVFLWIAS
jgi:glycyl-tRNA synthetase beta chain